MLAVLALFLVLVGRSVGGFVVVVVVVCFRSNDGCMMSRTVADEHD